MKRPYQMNRPKYEYRCGTCRSTDLVIRPVNPVSGIHMNCFYMWCSNGHQLAGSPTEYELSTGSRLGIPVLEFRTNRDWNRRLRYGYRD